MATLQVFCFVTSLPSFWKLKNFLAVSECSVVRDKKKQNKLRGFGFIFFDDRAAVDAVMARQSNNDPIVSKCGKILECKIVDEKKSEGEATTKENDSQADRIVHELFVGGTKDLDQDQLTEYFSQFGPVAGESCFLCSKANRFIYSVLRMQIGY